VRVFVASASQDSDWVDGLRRAIDGCPNPTWQLVPPIAAHPSWREQAKEAINGCDAFLFVTSTSSIGSPHCAWELATARALRKPRFQWIVETVDGEHLASKLPVVVGGVDEAPGWRFGCQDSSA
jgi:hypothetical protein